MKWLLSATLALSLLAGCGDSFDLEQQQEYIDKCLIEAGPHAPGSNALEYCRAKWRQSQREK